MESMEGSKRKNIDLRNSCEPVRSLGLLERIHWPLPLSEDLIAHDPTQEPLMIKAKRSNLYTMRPDEPRKEGRLALLEAP